MARTEGAGRWCRAGHAGMHGMKTSQSLTTPAACPNQTDHLSLSFSGGAFRYGYRDQCRQEAKDPCGMSGVIVRTHVGPRQAPGEPSKTRPSAPAGLAATRPNDPFCLIIGRGRQGGYNFEIVH